MSLFSWEHKTLRRNTIFVMALLSLVMLMHEVFGRNGYLTLRHQKKEYNALQQQIQTVSKQNKQLEMKIKALKKNPEAVEQQARDQLHLAKPGELIYMLPDRKPVQASATPQHTSPAHASPQR